MKKYVFFIVSIGVILAGLLFYNVYNVQKENMKNFEEPGYILQSASIITMQMRSIKLKITKKLFLKILVVMRLQQQKITLFTIIMVR